MSDRIEASSEPWSAIPRAVLRDARLSPAAKGGLVTLLSHEPGWVRSATAILQRECRCGRDAARSIMRELVAVGYARLERDRGDGGRFVSRYVVTPHVQATEPDARPGTASPAPVNHSVQGTELVGSPQPVGPEADAPEAVPPFAVVEPPDVDPREPETLPARKARRRDPVVDALALYADGAIRLEDVTPSRWRTLGVKAAELRKVDPDVTAEEVQRRAARFSSHFDATLTGPALVTHWARLAAAGTNGARRRPDPARELAERAAAMAAEEATGATI